MAMPNEPMRLDADDLYSPRVEAYLEEQSLQRRPIPEAAPRSWLVRLLFANYFYLSVASGVGALCAWAILEPFFRETAVAREFNLANFLIFPTVAGMLGVFPGGAEGP